MKKTILITGSTDGIGKATAIKCARKGATVIIHGRDEAKTEKTVKKIISKTGNKNISYEIADFSKLSQVIKMSESIHKKYDHIDILINNACVFEHNFVVTEDGFESTFQICYLAHFLLTYELWDLLKKSGEGRIINVSSMVHAHSLSIEKLNSKIHYNGYTAYETAKLANILFTYELNDRMDKDENIKVNSLHPGVISTKLLHKGWGFGGASVESGAETSIYLAFSEKIRGISGKYFVGKQSVSSSSITYDKDFRKTFWEYSENLLKEKGLMRGNFGDYK